MINQIGISRGSPLINFLSSADPSSRGPVRRFHISDLYPHRLRCYYCYYFYHSSPSAQSLPLSLSSSTTLVSSLFGNIRIFRRIRFFQFECIVFIPGKITRSSFVDRSNNPSYNRRVSTLPFTIFNLNRVKPIPHRVSVW